MVGSRKNFYTITLFCCMQRLEVRKNDRQKLCFLIFPSSILRLQYLFVCCFLRLYITYQATVSLMLRSFIFDFLTKYKIWAFLFTERTFDNSHIRCLYLLHKLQSQSCCAQFSAVIIVCSYVSSTTPTSNFKELICTHSLNQ